MNEELITRRLKGSTTLASTFGKGLRLAEDGGVARLDAVEGALGRTAQVSGRVEGSHGELYSTWVDLDLDGDDVIDYGCDCVAAASYPGMCKHAIALALEYMARRGTGPVIAARRHVVRTAPRRARDLPSSPLISGIMQDITVRRMNEASAARRIRKDAGAGTEPVELEVQVVPASDPGCPHGDDRTQWCVKMKVRRGKAAYVVKNAAALIEAYRTGTEAAYGKNLSFVHVPEAFSPSARALLEILSRVVRSQDALYRSRWRYREGGRGTDIRELPMSDADLIEALGALGGRPFTFQPDDGPYGAKGPARTLSLEEGDPEVPARLAPSSTGGYDLRVDGGAYCLYDGEGRMCILGRARAWSCSEGFARSSGALLSRVLPALNPLHISDADLPGFCRTVLPALQRAFDLEAPSELADLVPPEPSFTFRVSDGDGRVSCDARVAYGDWETSLYAPAYQAEQHVIGREPSRDMVAEYRAMDLVDELFPGGDVLPSFDDSDDELLYTLLTEGIPEMAELGEVLLSERLRRTQVRDSPPLTVKATVKSGLLDLEVGASGLSAQDLAAYLDSYRRREKFVRLSNGDIMRLGDGLAAVGQLAEGLGVDAGALAAGVHGVPANRVPFVDGLLKRADGVRLSRDDAFRAIVRDFDTFADADYAVPASLSGTLRGYQRDGFRWLEMLERLGFGGILADDMGLGKTLQMIAHMLAMKGRGTTLVVCPASLVYNWMGELARFAPGLDALAVIGPKSERREAIAAAGDHDVLVTSYDLMRRDAGLYAADGDGAAPFARIVLDEAQYIKNPGTQVARAAKRLPGRVRFALTGTPIENRAQELWSIFDFLMPGILGSRKAFAKQYGAPAEGGSFTAASRLRCLVAPFILRRLKGDVLSDLPDKTETVVYARMTGEQDKLYRANQDRLALQVAHELPDELKRRKLQVLAELMKLRQICCDPALAFDGYGGGSAKLDTAMELVSNAVDAGHKVLLFSQFTSMLDIIAARMREAGVGYLMLTGSTPREERARSVKRFQAGGADVFLISLKAGGVGLNLTAADVVIHFDPWWNLAAQDQATDRAYRIGQKNAVSVFKLICKDTIEEKILAMQEGKRELTQSVIGGEAMGAASLSREDILALLSASAQMGADAEG